MLLFYAVRPDDRNAQMSRVPTTIRGHVQSARPAREPNKVVSHRRRRSGACKDRRFAIAGGPRQLQTILLACFKCSRSSPSPCPPLPPPPYSFHAVNTLVQTCA